MLPGCSVKGQDLSLRVWRRLFGVQSFVFCVSLVLRVSLSADSNGPMGYDLCGGYRITAFCRSDSMA